MSIAASLLAQVFPMLGAAGLSENPMDFEPVVGLIVFAALIGLCSYLLLQNLAEILLRGGNASIRELLLITFLVAVLLAMYAIGRNLMSYGM